MMTTSDQALYEITRARILRAWDLTSDRDRVRGALWYESAGMLAAGMWPGHADRARAILAVLSPQAKWSANVDAAARVIDAARRGADMPTAGFSGGILPANVVKAWHIAQGEPIREVLGGPKVNAFYRNLSGNMRRVTIDSWMARTAGLEGFLTAKRYRILSAAFQSVAREVGTDPSTLQAVIWIAARGKAD